MVLGTTELLFLLFSPRVLLLLIVILLIVIVIKSINKGKRELKEENVDSMKKELEELKRQVAQQSVKAKADGDADSDVSGNEST